MFSFIYEFLYSWQIFFAPKANIFLYSFSSMTFLVFFIVGLFVSMTSESGSNEKPANSPSGGSTQGGGASGENTMLAIFTATTAGVLSNKLSGAGESTVINKTTIINIPKGLPIIKATTIGSLIIGACMIKSASVHASWKSTSDGGTSSFPTSPAELNFQDHIQHVVERPWIILIVGLELYCMILLASYIANRFSTLFTNYSDRFKLVVYFLSFFTCMSFLNPIAPVTYFASYPDSLMATYFIKELLNVPLSSWSASTWFCYIFGSIFYITIIRFFRAQSK